MKPHVTISILRNCAILLGSWAIFASSPDTRAQFLSPQLRQDTKQILSKAECASILQDWKRVEGSLKANASVSADAKNTSQSSPSLTPYELGEHLESCKFFEDAIDAYQFSFRLDHPSPQEDATASSLWTDMQIAEVLGKQQKLDQAMALNRKIWSIRARNQTLTQTQIDARAHNAMGYILLQDQQLEAARPYLETAIRLDSNYENPYHNLGILHIGQKKPDLAVEVLEQAVALKHPNYTSAQRQAQVSFHLGYYNLNPLGTESEPNFVDAKRWLKDSISKDQSNEAVYGQLVLIQLEEREFDQAIATLKQTLSLTPSEGETHQSIGNIYVKKNDIETALSHYKQAVKLTQKNLELEAEVYKLLGNALKAENRFSDAAKAYQKASQNNPADLKILESWGTSLWELEQWENAIEVFEKAKVILVAKDQALGSIPMLIKLAESYSNLNRVDEALAVLQPLMETDFFDPSLHLAYAKLLIQANQDTEAIEYFKSARGGSSQFHWGYFASEQAMVLMSQGNAFSELDRHSEAINLYEQAIALDPNFAYAYGLLAESLHQLEQYEKAVTAFQTALKTRPWKWQMRNTFLTGLGFSRLALNQVTEAREAFQQALQYQKENLEAHYGLGLTEMKAGKTEMAIAAFKQVLIVAPEHSPAQQALQKLATPTP